MVDARALGEEPQAEMPLPEEAVPVEVPIDSGVAPEVAPAVPVEKAPDLAAAEQGVEVAASEGVMPATEPAPIEEPAVEMPGMAATAGGEEDLNQKQDGPKAADLIGQNKHGPLEGMVGDQGPSPEEAAKKEVLPGEEPAIAAEEPAPPPAPYTVPPDVDGVTEFIPPHGVPAPQPAAPEVPEEGVSRLEPEYSEPLPAPNPAQPEASAPKVEADMTPEQAKAEIKRLWDEIITPRSIEYEGYLREINWAVSKGANPDRQLLAQYNSAYQTAQKAIAETIELEEKYIWGQESNLSGQVR